MAASRSGERIMTDKLNPQAGLSAGIQAHLGKHLRLAYDELCSEALPESLQALTERLRQALTSRDEAELTAFRDQLVAAVPSLRAFALSLTSNPHRADDLVQDTIVRAWEKRDSFTLGTNLMGWLVTILRNSFYSQHRKLAREVEDADGALASRLVAASEQTGRLEVQDLRAALMRISPDQREALLLVGAEGMSYEEVAAVCGVRIGTVKSRVNRARSRLSELMGYTPGDLATDGLLASVSQVSGRP